MAYTMKTKISNNGNYYYAITNDGMLYGWGTNYDNRFGLDLSDGEILQLPTKL